MLDRCQDLHPSDQVKIGKSNAGETKWFKIENFDDMVCKGQQQTLSLPPRARLRSADTSFGWKHYVTDAFDKFLSVFIEQLDVAFEEIEFRMAFDIFDPCKLPEKKEDLIQYGDNKLQDLGKHYGTQKVNRFEAKVNAQEADIDTTALTAELPLFKSIIFKKRPLCCSQVNRDISRAHLENVQEPIKKRESYTLQKLLGNLKHDNVVKEIYPNRIYLLHLLLIFPISIACVEHSFS